jgi:hypothetical protein
MSARPQLRRGAWIALTILLGLVLVPPIFVEKLDAWDAAQDLLRKDERLIAQCGEDARVNLSRWFYTYKFSGDNAQARFRGRVVSASCNRSLTVGLQRQAGEWKVSDLSL